VQEPIAGSIFEQPMGAPARRSQPTWYQISTQDEAIPPDARRVFASRMRATTIEVPAGHLAMVSHPDETAQLIKTAAESRVATPAGQGRR